MSIEERLGHDYAAIPQAYQIDQNKMRWRLPSNPHLGGAETTIGIGQHAFVPLDIHDIIVDPNAPDAELTKSGILARISILVARRGSGAVASISNPDCDDLFDDTKKGHVLPVANWTVWRGSTAGDKTNPNAAIVLGHGMFGLDNNPHASRQGSSSEQEPDSFLKRIMARIKNSVVLQNNFKPGDSATMECPIPSPENPSMVVPNAMGIFLRERGRRVTVQPITPEAMKAIGQDEEIIPLAGLALNDRVLGVYDAKGIVPDELAAKRPEIAILIQTAEQLNAPAETQSSTFTRSWQTATAAAIGSGTHLQQTRERTDAQPALPQRTEDSPIAFPTPPVNRRGQAGGPTLSTLFKEAQQARTTDLRTHEPGHAPPSDTLHDTY